MKHIYIIEPQVQDGQPSKLRKVFLTKGSTYS